MNNQNDNHFSTDAFYLASFLLSQSCRLLKVDKTNPRRMVFIFENNEHLKQQSELFLTHQASVEPHKLFSAQKDLKQLIYQQ